MANEMPSPEQFSGLTRKVVQFSRNFTALVDKGKTAPLTDADWSGIEQLVDTAIFRRHGVFRGAQAEVIDWPTYRDYVTKFGGLTSWEGTLRNVTEIPGRVILELEERCAGEGMRTVANTVTIYEFDEAEKLRHLDVYVMPLSMTSG